MSLDPLTAGLDILGTLIDRVFPDKVQAEAAKAHLGELSQNGEIQAMLAQIAVNNTEAASPNWFVAGWRPAIGWICGGGLGYQYLVFPWLVAIMPAVRPLDTATLMQLLGGLLGMAALRSWDKLKGTDTK